MERGVFDRNNSPLHGRGAGGEVIHDHSKMMQEATKTTPITASNKPDLVITKLIITPANPVVRDNINVKIEVKNQGTVALEKGIVVPLDIRFAGMGRKIDLVSRTHNTGIPAGETVIIAKNTNGPWSGDIGFNSDVAGEYTLTVDLDKANTIAESDDKNNTFTQKVTFSAQQNMTNYALERAMRGYSAVSEVDSVMQLLKQFPKMEETTVSALLKGITEGWNYKKKVIVNESDKAFLVSLNKNLVSENKDRLNRLMQAWQIKTDEVAHPNKITIVIKSVKEAMSYDKKEFTVTAGKTVELIFENPDAMQHNLVIGKPKSLEIIGKAANKMITQKDAIQKNYVPNIPQIIASTPLVNSEGSYKLTFKAPEILGDYPYGMYVSRALEYYEWSDEGGEVEILKTKVLTFVKCTNTFFLTSTIPSGIITQIHALAWKKSITSLIYSQLVYRLLINFT